MYFGGRRAYTRASERTNGHGRITSFRWRRWKRKHSTIPPIYFFSNRSERGWKNL